MAKHAFYSAEIEQFLRTDTAYILAEMVKANPFDLTDLQRDARTRIRHDAAFFGVSLEALFLLQRKYPADHFLIGRTNPRPLIFNRMDRRKVLIKRKTEFLFH